MDNNDPLTKIIALIGCITGICSLVLNFYKILSEKPKIKFEEYKLYLNGFCDNDNELYTSSKILIINLRISNVSLVPASLKSALIKYNDLILRPDFRYKIKQISVKHNKTVDYYSIDKQLTFPLIIEPMEIINCSLVFPLADKLFQSYIKNNYKPIEIVLTLFTQNKSLKFKTKVFELNGENVIKCQQENKEKLYRM
jgi:hypothetical protein